MGILALLHEPLIFVFDQLEMLGLEHNRPILLNFGEAVKEIFTRVPHSLIIFNLFPDRWQQLQQTFDGSIIDRISQYQVWLEPPTEKEIRAILELKAQAVDTDLTNLFTDQELQKIIGSNNSIRRVLNNAAEYFRYKYKNIPLPQHPAAATEETSSSIATRLERLESQQQRLEQLLTNIAQAFHGFIDSPPKTEPVNTENTSSSATQLDLDLNPTAPNLKPTLKQKIQNYLSTQQTILEQSYNESEILLDEKDIGKLQDIIAAFSHISELETDMLPSKKVFPPHRVITNKNLCIAFLSSCKGSKFTSRMQNFNQVVAIKEETRFIIWRDIRSDEIKQKTVGNKEINKLNNTTNGEFRTFERDNRITFELLHKLISDIYNQDLDINIETEFKPALKIATEQLKEYWLIQELLVPLRGSKK